MPSTSTYIAPFDELAAEVRRTPDSVLPWSAPDEVVRDPGLYGNPITLEPSPARRHAQRALRLGPERALAVTGVALVGSLLAGMVGLVLTLG